MPAEVVSHIVRRGLELGAEYMEKMSEHKPTGDRKKALDDLAQKLKSPAAMVTFGSTIIIYLVLTFLVEYAIRIVATNLAIVETNEHEGAIKLPIGDHSDLSRDPLLEQYDVESEERVGQEKPVTTSIRATFRHLSSIGGYRSRWRGLAMGIFYSITLFFFQFFFTSILSLLPVLGFIIGRLGAAVITCNLHAAWTHTVIATPTDKPFFQRFLTRKVARHLVLPTMRLHGGLLILQAATYGSLALSRHVISSHGFNWLTVNSLLIPVVAFGVISLGHVLPSQIALIRAEASLLSEDRSVVVNFDRTFGGRINWEGFTSRKEYILKNITVRGAYMTFDKPTYKRVLKMIIKCFMILIAITALFLALGFAEFFAIAGKEAKEAAKYAHHFRVHGQLER